MRLRMSKRYHIAVVGATGAVGVEMFRVLERRGFPVASIRAFSSKRSAGKSALFHDAKIPVAELAPDSFRGIDLALFSAGSAVAREFAPIARDAGAIAALEEQVRAAAESRPARAEVYPHPIAFNVLPQVDAFLESGYTKEEMKMQNEGRRIMHHPEFCASVTCVRVPVYRAHSVAVSAEFSEPVSVERAREVLAKAPGLELVDEPARNRYPMPLHVAGKDNCEVGRVRRDCAFENGLAFWVSGDQLLKGAALNAVQIAELL